MPVFFSDLDNTVLYSHRHIMRDPVIWVEELHGKQQSFMTKRYYEYFAHQDWLRVVPVTTRTYEQYSRLRSIAAKMKWEEALICNGSVLLRNGIEDINWRKESLQLSQDDQPGFKELYDKVVMLYPSEAVICVPGIMFYVKTDNPNKVFESIMGFADLKHVCIYRDSRKVYCLPASLNKGNAVKRYMKRLKNTVTLAAGDSEFDVSMLEQADVCLCPERISRQINETGEKIVCEGIFSDQICDEIEKIRKKENFGD